MPFNKINHGLQVQCEASSDPAVLNKETPFKPPKLLREEAFYFPFKKDVKAKDTELDKHEEAGQHAVVQQHEWVRRKPDSCSTRSFR